MTHKNVYVTSCNFNIFLKLCNESLTVLNVIKVIPTLHQSDQQLVVRKHLLMFG